ncbi:MAG: hypothetical protein DI551_07960 [Micavibrio aeruginosavorus]|uniref:Uncharacterized protein n=1 Tax=Micavibrio aeruginosavorus TaxID=349221 RepID=A0A2W5MWQ3_9BACT|nr:MAG: hypothetical protein DI551_07960 [Micavibrio aeruginosavorus]
MSQHIYWIFADGRRVGRVERKDRLTKIGCTAMLVEFAKHKGLAHTRGLTIKLVDYALDRMIPKEQRFNYTPPEVMQT